MSDEAEHWKRLLKQKTIECDELRVKLAVLTAEVEGTDPLAGDPRKWGLRAVLEGTASQRDKARAAFAELQAQGVAMLEALCVVLPPALRLAVLVEADRLRKLKAGS